MARLTQADLRAIWRNLDLSSPDSWYSYDYHDHSYEAVWTYNFHGVTISVDGQSCREPWLGPEDITAITLTDSSGNEYNITELYKTPTKS